MIELAGPSIEGKAVSVRLSRPVHTGESAVSVRIGAGGVWATIAEARVVSSFRTTTVELRAGVRVATVEHLYAALAGLGVRGGLEVEVTGGALPLLDGGAARFVEALSTLGLGSPAEPCAPALRVAKDGGVELGGARATFERGDRVVVVARVVGLGRALDAEATWSGGSDDFRARVAPARTFLVTDDADAMLAAGMSAAVSPESVIVVDRERGAFGIGSIARDEPARHKLLDLIGDLYAWGGPPLGVVVVERPGHSVNHAIVERALSEGILARS